MHETTECANELCNCVLTAPLNEETYCSDGCRGQTENGIESETCGCGHPPCDAP